MPEQNTVDVEYHNFEERLNGVADDTGYVRPSEFQLALGRCLSEHRMAVWDKLLVSPKWITVALMEDEVGAWQRIPVSEAIGMAESGEMVAIATKKRNQWVLKVIQNWVSDHVSPLSAILFVLTMSATHGWVVGVGLFVMLLVHEFGHMYVAKRLNVMASPPVFMPFIGAVINLRVPEEPIKEAMIGIGGPLIGGVFAMLVMVLAGVTGSESLQKAAAIGMTINLFNLLPVRPMDGGRILQVLSPWVQVAGLVVMALLTWKLLAPLLLFMLVAGVVEARLLFKERRHTLVPWSAKVVITVAYFITMASLVYGLVATEIN